MTIDGIISHIAALDWDRVKQTPRGEVYEVCVADEEDWKLFADSDAAESKCCKMEWIEGKVVIVELSSRTQQDFVAALSRYMWRNDTVQAHLHFSQAARTPPHLRQLEPDLCCGPLPQCGGILPPGIRWEDWDTLKIEIGYSRGWSHRPGQLDWKANEWAKIPGVNYILCVKVEDRLASATYKLYTVLHHNRRLPIEIPIRIEAPRTVVKFDSRLLLGLAPRERLPAQPPVPARVAIDLYAILEYARVRC
ncbi:hypothetical protein PR003_g19946 [Phytophthora rubi]|uniref:Uncharacterized protein n=1 Tax=Phytophthora rubi TaxID=129364 RepID=A0A6A3K7T2_9STRA|nr:hypothetical protein PR002_g19300 [Phytophthora rubi]KAE9000204.1 hypothetical protein PR001_g18848 [Phytophthora rubi]KAE9311707.1 hypothetical protein PR003_g19946 [Phytophthora rubi]